MGGDPARVIAARVRAADARLIVIGRTMHVAGAWHEAGLALRLWRLTDMPVLAVQSGLRRLPRHAVLAVYFSPYSVYAGQVTLSLAAHDLLVHLVYVRPAWPPLGGDAEEWLRGYERTLGDDFARVRADLGGDDGQQYESVILAGESAMATAEFATAAASDLVTDDADAVRVLRIGDAEGADARDVHRLMP